MQRDTIETFLDLVESRSFHRTAERLGVTQSTVSARLAALEADLGARLFTRSRAGTDLTTEGLKFAPHARALRMAWTQARQAVTPIGESAVSIQLGIQSDLAPLHIGEWVKGFRHALPQAGFYIEPDFSAQMCRDLASGTLDFAVLYTPYPGPDLHFTTLGETRYRLVATEPLARRDLTPDRYIRANFAPAFDAAHRAALPELSGAPVAAGQNATILGLLTTLGGAAYVTDQSAADLIATGRFHAVTGAPVIGQPVHAATHLRNRTTPLHRTLLKIVRQTFTA